MKRLLLALATFVALPFGFMVGCNSILGTEPADLGGADAALDVQTVSDAGSDCGPGTKDCAGVCVDVTLPTNGCAGSCNACPTPKNAEPACALQDDALQCALGACNTGFADCNSNSSDGCEALLTSKTSCGSCDKNCVDAGFTFCSPGTGCSNTCNGTDCCGTAACASQTDPNGECVDTTSNPSNCGSCGHDCTTIAGAAQVDCVSGACVVRSCVAGMALCNGVCVPQSNSACGNTCANCTSLAEVCVGGVCQGCSGGSKFCGSSCCAQNCCGTGPTAICQGQACPCPSGEFQCGVPSNCCASGTQVCCNSSQCTTEGNAACGTSCAVCSTGTHCDLTNLPHACACKNAGDTLCHTTTTPATYWCCGTGMVCGASAGQCNPAPCSGAGQCDLGGGVCGCGTAVDCRPATTSPNCGGCGTSCSGTAGSCCCASTGDAGATYSCQGGHPLRDGGGTDCTGCNP